MSVTPRPIREEHSLPTLSTQPPTVGEIAHVLENIEAFRSCCDWITSYLAKPHPHLGRSGSVCPFAAPAISKDTLRVAVVRFTDTTDKRSQVIGAVMQYRDAFLKAGNSDDTRMLHATLILFPDVQSEEAPELIDTVKEDLKTLFVEQGLMLGEFHSKNNSPGLHNPAFKPLRSAVPMLAIRRMVATDYVFLNRADYDTATRLRYIEAYLNASNLPASKVRTELETTIDSLRAELKNLAA
jgi:uncharacterized protein DUF6875